MTPCCVECRLVDADYPALINPERPGCAYLGQCQCHREDEPDEPHEIVRAEAKPAPKEDETP